MNSRHVVFWLRLGAGSMPCAPARCRRSGPTPVTHVGQRSHDSIVSPAGILPSHFNDQRLKILPDSWPPGIPAVFGAVEFAGDQPAIPGQNGGWLGHTGHFRQSPGSESLADLGERGPFGIGQTQSRRQVPSQDPVSAVKYSFWRSNSWLTRPVTYASRRSHLLSLMPSVHNTPHYPCFVFLDHTGYLQTVN